MSTPDPTADGRRARRQRSRLAVLDATVDLIQEHGTAPSAEAVAARARVSASSLFRYFDNLSDLQHAAVARFFERYADRYVIADLGQGDRTTRIRRYVATLDALFDLVAPIARLVRARAFERPHLVEEIGRVRRLLTDQARVQFAPELSRLSPAARDDLVSLLASSTSFEAWDLQRRELGRSSLQIRRSWRTALDALLPNYCEMDSQ